MKRITVNVDDLGLSPAVNQAVLQLAERGRIQSTSLMSLGRLAADEAAHLRALGISIGLHFDLTGLAGLGSLQQVLWRSYRRGWPAAVLSAAVARQLDAFEDLVGSAPAFVDGHQHVHQLPQVRETLLRAVQARYGAGMYWRSTRPLLGDVKSRIIYALGGRRFERRLQAQGDVCNRILGGVYGFDGDATALAQRWAQWLAAAPEAGCLLMCHPAVPQGGWQDEIRPAREREWQWLGSDAFAELWAEYACRGVAIGWAAGQAA